MMSACPECDSDDVVLSGPAEMDSVGALLCKSCGYSGSLFSEKESHEEPRSLRAPAPKKLTKRKSKK